MPAAPHVESHFTASATVRDVAMTVHPHPTFSEALQEAALLWLGEPMHVARRRSDAGAR